MSEKNTSKVWTAHKCRCGDPVCNQYRMSNQGSVGFTADDARLISAAPALFYALTMVRDADDDCHKDGLPTIPDVARATIDWAIAKAEGGAS